MSKVIKNNDGVAVVEGTPAASLVKDVDRIFTTKPPKRMAGDNIAQPRKIPKMEEKLVSKPQVMPAVSSPNIQEKTPEEKEMKREEAVEKTKEFKRQRSDERPTEEQEPTQGKFITSLGR